MVKEPGQEITEFTLLDLCLLLIVVCFMPLRASADESYVRHADRDYPENVCWGDAHPLLSPDDEFANYETGNSWKGASMEGVDSAGWEERKRAEYARSALKSGLEIQSRGGINPFKFGMTGSTDAHTSLATADENNFWGKFTWTEPGPDRLNGVWGDVPQNIPMLIQERAYTSPIWYRPL